MSKFIQKVLKCFAGLKALKGQSWNSNFRQSSSRVHVLTKFFYDGAWHIIAIQSLLLQTCQYIDHFFVIKANVKKFYTSLYPLHFTILKCLGSTYHEVIFIMWKWKKFPNPLFHKIFSPAAPTSLWTSLIMSLIGDVHSGERS